MPPGFLKLGLEESARCKNQIHEIHDINVAHLHTSEETWAVIYMFLLHLLSWKKLGNEHETHKSFDKCHAHLPRSLRAASV